MVKNVEYKQERLSAFVSTKVFSFADVESLLFRCQVALCPAGKDSEENCAVSHSSVNHDNRIGPLVRIRTI